MKFLNFVSAMRLPLANMEERGITCGAINFSGGRTSGYMLHRLAEQGIPDNFRVVFCNTGLEHPATLDFVAECERRMGVKIHWLEYVHRSEAKGGIKDPKNTFREVDYSTASRNGEPMSMRIKSNKFMPIRARRQCTQDLKVETCRRFMRREFGAKTRQQCHVIGIRADETRRVDEAMLGECRVYYPLVDAGITKSDVDAFWAKQTYDLGLPSDGRLGNCVMCFMKSRVKLIRNLKEDPSRADFWQEHEDWLVAQGRSRKDVAPYGGDNTADLVKHADMVQELPLDDGQDNLGCFCGD